MAWRFRGYRWVKKGILDNRILGTITGSIFFAALGEVKFILRGDMRGKLKGKIVEFINPDYTHDFVFYNGRKKITAQEYFERFRRRQVGVSGDIMADNYLYLEWYSDANGRCVIEIPRANCCLIDPNSGPSQSLAPSD
jgi:hypothetical protein